MSLNLIDVIHRSLENKQDVEPLVKYLGMNENVLDFSPDQSRVKATEIANYFRKQGSNDIATFFRGNEGVEYREILVDVGKKLKAKVSEDNSIEKNEELILLTLFEGALDRMTDDEKRQTLRAMGLKEKEIPIGPISTALIQGLLRQYGGFYVYQISVIVANMVSRAILGTGLTFATNAAITRSVGAFLGPIGWLATGLWLAVDLAGPAYRKTVPAVVHIALLRTMLLNRITIGVVGDGSSGKDSLIKAVFGLDADISPIAGSTSKAESFPLNEKGNAVIVNYPGFNDYRPEVEAYTDAYLHHTDVFVMVVDINRGVSKTDIEILNKVKSHGKPVLVCLNKVDLPRTTADLESLEKAAQERLVGCDFIKTAFDPDTRLQPKPIGCEEVYAWIKGKVKSAGKNIDSENFPPFPEH
jgi:small GTP-binding protein